MIDYKNKPCLSGFSLVELLMALMVTSIILTAVVTLAFALNTAYDDTSDISEKQAKIRFVSLNISELIDQGKLNQAKSKYKTLQSAYDKISIEYKPGVYSKINELAKKFRK